MKKIKLLLILTVAALVCITGCNQADAQNVPNFDPQQMQQMIERMEQQAVDAIRDQLQVTNDTEWNALEPQISKVMKGRIDTALNGSGLMAGIRMMMGNRGNNLPSFGTPDPDAEALQQLIDDNAPPKQIRAALDRYRVTCQRKADALAKDQDQLRRALTPRQEAILSIAGLLD